MYQKKLDSFFIKERPFTIQEVAKALSFTRSQAAKVLYRLKNQGHILHLKNGVYFPVSHKGLTPEESFGDPWVIVPTLFPDAYVGGWTAAHYWGLTEQLFRTTVLMKKGVIHHTCIKIVHFEYYLFRINNREDFGEEKIWKEHIQVPISDVHKTMVDMIENPTCGAGIQNTIDCFKVYLREYYDEPTFSEYSKKIKNGSYFKRLGYLSEVLLGGHHSLCVLAKDLITKNYTPIDPHISCKKLITKWNLYISEDITI